MSDSSPLVLKNFSGVPEITLDALRLKRIALCEAEPIKKVETEGEQALAVTALQSLKAISRGMESTRKAVKGPVLELGKKIDAIAADFIQEVDRHEMRLHGLVNHYQREQLRLKREADEKLAREQSEAQRLADEAKRLREQAERESQPELIQQAVALETRSFNAQMEGELSGSEITVAKPKGLVVKQRLNFQVTDAIVFCQAYPQFFNWNAETETLKLKRREILEELNRGDGKGIFHMTQFPEELPDEKGSRLAKPPGIRVFEETKSHVR